MKKLLILSGKGGTGKTTTAAAFLHFSGARAVADCDVDAPNLHLVAQRQGAPRLTPFRGGDKAIIDPARCIACGRCMAHCRFEAIIHADGACSVSEIACEGCGVCAHVCPADAVTLVPDSAGEKALYLDGESAFSTATLRMGRGNSGKLVSEVKLAMLTAAPRASLAIVDGSPGIGCPVIASMAGMDLVLVVAEPSLSGLSDLQRLIRTARTFGTPLAVCVNKWDVSPGHTRQIEAFCQGEGIPFLGGIPYDGNASRAINEGRSLAEIDCPARTALHNIYEAAMALLEP